MADVCAAHHPNTVSPRSNRSRNKRQSKSNRVGGINSPGQIRIIGGQWRGRRIEVVDVEGLRPSGDRIRETLFNWLRGELGGSRCLDLFAGSGVLGFEALSRLAASCTFVESDARAFGALQTASASLGVETGERATLVQGRAAEFLAGNRQCFDIVFIDPPFEQDLQWDTLETLANGHLAVNALVYVESPVGQPVSGHYPPGLQLHREKRFGDVVARLLAYPVTS
ncbi:MAG: 16S rRNA (guanine(966)-N(2))-methyltransferase RsmD [Granulosicoccus sp.]|nr:16S rRNA (guanine(966)-N(2))-methyltransferase RsmD [Granulosicoccus sp.]